jgi:O-methyltransferase
VEELLAALDAGNTTVLEGVFPEETAGRIPDGPLALCHIDVDVYQSARDATDWVWPRMPVGGVIVYDDYGFYGCEGVTALGQEEYERPDGLFLHNLSGQAFLVKLPA